MAAESNSELLGRIQKQIEFYFSDQNLRKDKFMQSQLEESECTQ